MIITTNGITHFFEDDVPIPEHTLAVSCWCNPTMGVNSVLTHHVERYSGPAGLTSEFPLNPNKPHIHEPNPRPSVWPTKRPHCRLFHNWGTWSETVKGESDDGNNWYQYRLCYRCKRIKRIWI